MTTNRHCSVALLAATIAWPGVALAQPEPGAATLLVFVQGRPVGQERVTLTRTGGGWRIEGDGRIGQPFDLVTRSFAVRYTSDWQPVDLSLSATLRGESIDLSTSFGLTTAISEIAQRGRKSAKTDEMPARSVVLPGNFFGAYEALAARLAGAEAGTELPVYFAPQGATRLQVRGVSRHELDTTAGHLSVLRYLVTQQNANAPLELEIWVDERLRLARLEIPTASLVVTREEFASVMTRVEVVRHPGDEDVIVPANGFNLATTLTKPAGAAGRGA